MNIKNAKEISEKLNVFRDEKHRNLSAPESKFFGEFSTIFTESEQNKISTNTVEQIKYLAGVVQFVKRKIRGNQGNQETGFHFIYQGSQQNIMSIEKNPSKELLKPIQRTSIHPHVSHSRTYLMTLKER